MKKNEDSVKKIFTIENDLKSTNKENSDLQAELEQLALEKNSFINQANNAERKLKLLTGKISFFENEKQELNEEIKQKDEEIINLFTSIHKFQSKQPKRDQLITYHRKYDENNVLVDTISFNFDKQESEGTKKLLYLLGPWYDTLKNGKVLSVFT